MPRWLLWERRTNPTGRPTRRPAGSTLQPADWCTFDKLDLFDTGDDEHGAGFVLTGTVPVAGGLLLVLDLDACVWPDGSVAPWAREILDRYPSYCEFSPSGKGLHLCLIVKKLASPIPRIRVSADAPPGVDKHPEIQVFGLGPAGYVTWTDRPFPGPATIETFADLSWLEQHYEVGLFRTTQAEPGDLPVGAGDAPSLDAIADILKADPGAQALVEGDWRTAELTSASEGWWRLTRAVLRAANNHGRTATRFLLDRTAYGSGAVDSRDPARYARVDWVERDMARIAAKTDDVGGAVFADGFDVAAWVPPVRLKPSDADPWVLPFEAFRERRASRRFLLKGLLPARGLAQFFGDPASGKTPFAISLAVHVAAGLPWFGHQLKRAGSVVYMVGEDESGIVDRIAAQLQRVDPLIGAADLPLFATTRPGQLSTPSNRQRWAEEIRAALKRRPCPQLSLLVIDTQSRNFGPGNENDTEAMAAFVEQVDALGRQLDCLTLLVHHTGHMNKERGRGSSVLFAALDACYEVTRDGPAVVLTSRKAKNWADAPPIFSGLTPMVVGIDEDGDDVTAITLDDKAPAPEGVFTLDPREDTDLVLFLRAVHEIGGRRISLNDFCVRCHMSKRQLRNRVDEAVTDGYLRVRNYGGRTTNVYILTPRGKGVAGVEEPEV